MSGRKAPGKLAPREGHAKVHQEDKDDRDRQRFRAGGGGVADADVDRVSAGAFTEGVHDFVPFEFGWELLG
jgi:hypothetical protein